MSDYEEQSNPASAQQPTSNGRPAERIYAVPLPSPLAQTKQSFLSKSQTMLGKVSSVGSVSGRDAFNLNIV